MHSLVLWLKADPRTSSVLSEKQIRTKKSTTFGKWGDQWHEVQIIATSDDVEYLESLNVDVTGRIMTPERRKSFPHAVMVKKREMASKKRKATAAASSVSVKSDEKLLKEKSIFSDSGDDDDGKEAIHVEQYSGQDHSKKLFYEDRGNEKIKKNGQKLKENRCCDKKRNNDDIAKLPKKRRIEVTEGKKEKFEPLREKGMKDEQQRESYVQEREKAQQYQKGKQSTNNEHDGAIATDCVEDDELHSQEDEPRKDVYASDPSQKDEPRGDLAAGGHSQEAESPRGVGAADNSQDDELNVYGVGRDENDEAGRNADAGRGRDDDNDENQDPNITNSLVSARPEEGKLQLIRGIPIYVDATELNYMKMKWRAKPEELTRRLMKLIVGNDKLKEMTPTGRANTPSIPQAVYKAVFLSVNKNLPEGEDKLPELRYRRVLTNMCNTLRNPKKKR
ncbi:hypothetical protein TSAR_012876 [Trichomalopsis sarcophagae]|uniref:BEN domain-containing protein n=1 Tax=Trichomalopsis sarcophagae TaxID=543379 RepID=A0A232EPR2_9HYME|nr:hypothetical protein TSAR_012876 [Trichomalopsis sarcophagae]